jgi:hypothetical protein
MPAEPRGSAHVATEATDTDREGSAELSALRRRILMHQAAYSLAIGATPPCSRNGFLGCKSAHRGNKIADSARLAIAPDRACTCAQIGQIWLASP